MEKFEQLKSNVSYICINCIIAKPLGFLVALWRGINNRAFICN